MTNLQVFKKFLGKTNAEDIITALLEKRKIERFDRDSFFSPKEPSSYSLISDLKVKDNQFKIAVKRLKQAFENQESVVVYGDYDVDGISSSAIIWQSLNNLGFKIMPYLPDRKKEGYGFSIIGIENIFHKYKPKLVITVDHGINSEKYLKLIKTKGADVIIIDHHLKNKTEPESGTAIIYSKKVCATALAYFFIKEFIVGELKKNFWKGLANDLVEKISRKINQDFMVLAGIATITDIMPLINISRSLAFHALKNITKVENVGLRELLTKTGLITKNKHSSYDIGFIIGPRINAAGRIGDPLDALRLLCTESQTQAKLLSLNLEGKNIDRQEKLQAHLKLAEELVSKQLGNSCFVICSNKFEEGIVGLLAAKLLDKYYRPVLCGVIVDGQIKGSARSVGEIDIVKVFEENSDLLISYGGHKKAAGFVLESKNIDKFILNINKTVKKKLKNKELVKTIDIDCETILSNLNLTLAKEVERFGPFGVENPEPLFLSKDVTIVSQRTVGKTGQHVQLILRDLGLKQEIKAVFFKGTEALLKLVDQKTFSIVYQLGVDAWREEKLNLIIKEIF